MSTHLPKHFEETRTEVLHSLMRAHPLAAFVTLGAAELFVNHIPFLISVNPEPFGTLRGHVARANPVWRMLSDTVESVAVFQGPESYISPSWYPSKHEHGKAVPTWNYAVVHAYGLPRFVDDPAWLFNHLNEMTDQHEASRTLPWKVTDAPKDFTEKMIQAIVGIEIPISKLSGKWKVSQNRSAADKLGVVAGLEFQDKQNARAMAALVRETIR